MLRSRMLSRVGPDGSCRLFSRRGAWLVSVGGDECPAEAGQFACDGDRDDRAAFAALGVEALPDLVQASLGLPGDLDDVSGLSVLAAAERLSLGWCAAGRGTTSARCPCGSFSDAALPNPA
jgi:hypothetical protein